MEIEIAERVQRALLPERPALDGLEIAVTMESGDLFDVARLSRAIEALADETPARIRDGILARVRSYQHAQEDDMTQLVARYRALHDA